MHCIYGLMNFFKFTLFPKLLMAVPFKSAATDQFNNYGMKVLANSPKTSDAYNTANYYLSFQHYLNVTQPIAYWITTIFGWISEMLYYIAKALIEVFVKLFDIFTLTSNNPTINGILSDVKGFGTLVLILAILILIASYIFHPTNGYDRFKTVGWNLCIIMCVSCAVPYFVPKLTKGIQSTAHVLLQTRTTTTVKIPDYIVQTNVLDLPDVAINSFVNNKGNLPDYVNHSKKNKIFVSTTNYSNGIKIKPFMINESQMNQKQLDLWSGFNGTDAGNFLANVGNNENNLNNDTLTDWKAKINKASQIAKMKAQAQQLAKDKKKIKKSKNIFDTAANMYQYAHDAEWDALGDLGTMLINTDILSKFGIKSDGAKILAIFTYHPSGIGDDTTLQKFSQFDSNYGGGLFDVAAHPLKSILGPAFQESYTRYSVNWFNIWLGLIFVIFAMAVYIFKLIKTWYKMVVMYVFARPIIAKHIGNSEKVKEYIYNFFGLFEILLADVVVVYLMFFCYTMLNSELGIIIYSFKSAAFANPLTSAVIIFIADWALFQAGIGSIDAVNSQVGGKANTAGHQESLLQTLTALKLTSSVAKGAGNAAKPVAEEAGSLGKSAWQGMRGGGKDARKNKLDTKNGGLGKTADGSLGSSDSFKPNGSSDSTGGNSPSHDADDKDATNNDADQKDGSNFNNQSDKPTDSANNIKPNKDALKDAANRSDSDKNSTKGGSKASDDKVGNSGNSSDISKNGKDGGSGSGASDDAANNNSDGENGSSSASDDDSANNNSDGENDSPSASDDDSANNISDEENGSPSASDDDSANNISDEEDDNSGASDDDSANNISDEEDGNSGASDDDSANNISDEENGSPSASDDDSANNISDEEDGNSGASDDDSANNISDEENGSSSASDDQHIIDGSPSDNEHSDSNNSHQDKEDSNIDKDLDIKDSSKHDSPKFSKHINLDKHNSENNKDSPNTKSSKQKNNTNNKPFNKK